MNNVFLNGDLQEEVHMAKLDGFKDVTKPKYVCKLLKVL